MPRNVPGSCLDLRGGPTAEAPGTPMQIWDCWQPPNQKFYLDKDAGSPSNWTLIRPESGNAASACVDVAGGGMTNGTPLEIDPCTVTTNYEFYLTPTA